MQIVSARGFVTIIVLPEHYQRPGWFTTHLFRVGPDSSDDELRRIAADHPVSRLQIS